MEKIDARKLPREVLEEKRRMVMRLREELNLTWKEIARGGWQGHLTMVLGGSKRSQQAGEAGLQDRRRGRAQGEGRRAQARSKNAGSWRCCGTIRPRSTASNGRCGRARGACAHRPAV